MSIEEILDEMENQVMDAAHIPLTNKRLLDEDDFIRFLDEIRESLPKEMIEANRIIAERQRILDAAQKEAQNIVEQAKNYIVKLTNENIITKQAQEQANEIVAQAQKSYRDLQLEAVKYAEDVFRHLETNLNNALTVVRQGHSDLHQKYQNSESPQD